MRVVALTLSLLPMLLGATTATAQTPSLLRDLPVMQVMIDHFRVPMTALTDQGADSLRQQVVLRLRAAGMNVADQQRPVTSGSFLNAGNYPFDKPTFLVSLNMVPDGCAFVVNFHVRMPVNVVGYRDSVAVTVYSSSSYIYSTDWRDHSPVFNYLDDFIDAWRNANAG